MDDFDDIVLDDYTLDNNPSETTQNDTTTQTDTQAPEPSKTAEKIKFNESLLLETKGIPLLRNEARYIEFKGKGHEAEDLNRLITYYTVWASNLYPKFRFKDFIRRVQKPASGDRLKKMVQVWQDEHKEKLKARREVFQELSGETVGDVDGGAEEESSDDDNRPLFFPISEEAAEAMKKNRKGNKKTKSTTTTASKSSNKYNSKDTIHSSDEEDDDNEESTSKPRTITFSDSEDDDESPIRKKKPESNPVNGRAHALAILAEKRRQKLQAQKVVTPQKEKEEDEDTNVQSQPSRKRILEDSDEEDYDQTLRKILDGKPSGDSTVEKLDIPTNEDNSGLLDDIVMEDINDLDNIEMEEV